MLSSPLERLGRLTGQALNNAWSFAHEYMLVRRPLFLQRPDLVEVGRSLWGKLDLQPLVVLAEKREEETHVLRARDLEPLFHHRPHVLMIPDFKASGQARDLLEQATSHAAQRHAPLLGAFGVSFEGGVWHAPTLEWPFQIVEAILAESLSLLLDGSDLHPISQVQGAQDAFHELLSNSSIQALELSKQELEGAVRQLYTARAAQGLREVELLLRLFPEETRELAHLYGQSQSLGAQAQLEVLHTLIEPAMQTVARRLAEREAREPNWPFPKTKELAP